jgi:hypothetical protein
MSEKRHNYDDEFTREAIRLVTENGGSSPLNRGEDHL